MKHTVFLSYASAQGEVAARIELALKGEGHAVFRDRSSLPPGESFDERSAMRSRKAGEPRPQGWGGFAFIKGKLWSVYSEALTESRQKPRFLAALPPAPRIVWLAIPGG